MKKARQPKGAMRAQLARVSAERDAATTQVSVLERKIEQLQQEQANVNAFVDRIFHHVSQHQPFSSLLPEGLRSNKFEANWTRMAPPCNPLLDYSSPIVLHDLLVKLEENFATWERLVTIALKPSSAGVSGVYLNYKVSDETLRNEAARKYLADDVTRRFFRELDKQFK